MNGLILFNKSLGKTSAQSVAFVKKTGKFSKAGHCGTLDPLAQGLLVIGAGPVGTKMLPYLQLKKKCYRVRLRLGIATASGDLEGPITQQAEVKIPAKQQLHKLFANFVANYRKQVPPMYSSLKHRGIRLYKLARKNIRVKRKNRPLKLYDMQLLSVDRDKDELLFDVCCSPGTYIRVLGEDLAQASGTVGCLSGLIRTAVGKYHLCDAIDEAYLQNHSPEQIQSRLLRIERVLPEDMAKIHLTSDQSRCFCRGQPVKHAQSTDNDCTVSWGDPIGETNGASSLQAVMHSSNLIGLGSVNALQQVVPKKVFMQVADFPD